MSLVSHLVLSPPPPFSYLPKEQSPVVFGMQMQLCLEIRTRDAIEIEFFRARAGNSELLSSHVG